MRKIICATALLGLMIGCIKQDSSNREGAIPRRASNAQNLGVQPIFVAPPEVSPKMEERVVPKKKQIVVMDFWAPWCGPCVKFAPTFAAWSKKYSSENVKFVKVNIDNEPDMKKKYDITAIPTVIVEVDGKVVARFEGAPQEEQIVAHISK
jgi:thioredoxin